MTSSIPIHAAAEVAARRSAQLLALAERMTSRPELPFCVPGLAVVISRRDGTGARAFVGVDGVGTPLADDTLFPIASASKLALGLALLQLVERGAISLDDELAALLPRAAAARPGVTLRALMSHTSGLPLDLPPALASLVPTLDWSGIADACLRTPLAHAPRSRVQYSNTAYGLLALVIEQVTGSDFRAILEERIFTPLRVEACIGRVLPRPPAYTIDMDSDFVGTGMEPYNSAFWQRLGTPWAGIYTTADGLLGLLRAWAEPSAGVVSAATIAEARRDQTGGLAGGFATSDPFLGFRGSRPISWSRCPWGLAVELRGAKRPHWTSAAASPDSFGQIGASGCVAWCDPHHEAAWVALAPRTTDNGWLLRHGPAIANVALDDPPPPRREPAPG